MNEHTEEGRMLQNGDFAPSKGHLAMARDIFGCHSLGSSAGI